MTTCPCQSSKSILDCCQPIIDHNSAPTAEALMRSRYTAYAAGNAEYLIKTWHPAKQHLHSLQEIDDWAKSNRWDNLEIIMTEKGLETDKIGTVEFKAYFTDASGQKQILHERSAFEKIDGKWYYVDGIINPPSISAKTERNAPCPCGSGKKFKKCCGK